MTPPCSGTGTRHLPAQMVRSHDAQETVRADGLLDQVRSLQQRALGILERADAEGDARTVLLGVREVARTLELQGNCSASCGWPGSRRRTWTTAVLCGHARPRVHRAGEVRPRLVEVEYRQRLRDGVRHAALKGIGPDKRPRLIRRSALGERGPF